MRKHNKSQRLAMRMYTENKKQSIPKRIAHRRLKSSIDWSRGPDYAREQYIAKYGHDPRILVEG